MPDVDRVANGAALRVDGARDADADRVDVADRDLRRARGNVERRLHGRGDDTFGAAARRERDRGDAHRRARR